MFSACGCLQQLALDVNHEATTMTCTLVFVLELMQPQADVVSPSSSCGAAPVPVFQELQTSATSENHLQLQTTPTPQFQPESQQLQQSSQYFQHNEGSSELQPSADTPSATRGAQSSEGRKISCEDIQLVQNLIERCLQLYMNQAEVINTLLNQAKIEPGFTGLVWQKLEEQNPDFFKAYYTRLKLKKHIMLFNHLLEHQVQLMQKMRMLPTKTLSPSSVPNHPSVQNVPLGFPMPHQSTMTVSALAHDSSIPKPPQNPLLQDALHMNDNIQLSQEGPEQSGITEMMELPSDLHSSGSGLNSDLNLGSMNLAIQNGAAFPFNTITSSLDMNSIGICLPTSMPLDTATFCANDPHSQNGINLPLSTSHDGDENSTRESLGPLGPIPRNFSLSDLTAELGSHSDLGGLGSYSSPFGTCETENFLLYPEKENYDDSELLDPIEETRGMELEDMK